MFKGKDARVGGARIRVRRAARSLWGGQISIFGLCRARHGTEKGGENANGLGRGKGRF